MNESMVRVLQKLAEHLKKMDDHFNEAHEIILSNKNEKSCG